MARTSKPKKRGSEQASLGAPESGATVSITSKQSTQVSFRGPIPPPKILEAYERVLTGSADRLLAICAADQDRDGMGEATFLSPRERSDPGPATFLSPTGNGVPSLRFQKFKTWKAREMGWAMGLEPTATGATTLCST